MIDRIDTAGLLARTDIVAVIGEHVPLKKAGSEYRGCCPFHSEKTPSFTVTPAVGKYYCFGCGQGGDAIGFLVSYLQVSFVEACRMLGADVGQSACDAPAQTSARAASHRAPRREPDPSSEKRRASSWAPILPAPSDAPDPPRAHVARGIPERVWQYRNQDGALLGYVYRFRTSNGGKEVLPLTWCANAETGATEWHWMAFPEPRPMYGLQGLSVRPDSTVLIVEGEKCADAARAALSELTVLSWPGGGKAVGKVDWKPLSGRKVVLWPDADAKREPLTPAEKSSGIDPASKPFLPVEKQPGVKAMQAIAEQLLALSCRVWIVDIPEPGVKPDGWDVADAIDDDAFMFSLAGSTLADWVRSNARPFVPPDALVLSGGEGEPPPGIPVTLDDGDGDEWGWQRRLFMRRGTLVDCRENIYLVLRNHPVWRGVIWADEFASRIVKRAPAPWDDPATFVAGTPWLEVENLKLAYWLAENVGLLVRSDGNVDMCVGWAASEQRYNPLTEWLDGLVWDGQERISHWMVDFLGAKNTEYAQLVGKMFLLSMVARAYQPGCAMRAMPILEGEQNRGKSTCLRILGGEWFSDEAMDLRNIKDAYALIQGVWLFEIGELDAFNKAESSAMKAFISRYKDTFRAPYDRKPKSFARQTMFVGTVNGSEYFKDQTGNTRYWPIRVEELWPMKLEELKAARAQLFAEAVHRYRNKERWWPTTQEQATYFREEQAQREIGDDWETAIRRYLNASTRNQISSFEILTDCLKVEVSKIDGSRQMTTRVGICMNRIGWIKRRSATGDREWLYHRPESEIAREAQP